MAICDQSIRQNFEPLRNDHLRHCSFRVLCNDRFEPMKAEKASTGLKQAMDQLTQHTKDINTLRSAGEKREYYFMEIYRLRMYYIKVIFA